MTEARRGLFGRDASSEGEDQPPPTPEPVTVGLYRRASGLLGYDVSGEPIDRVLELLDEVAEFSEALERAEKLGRRSAF